MEFPEKYIKRGTFTLHSGEKSNIFYDVNALLTDSDYLPKIINSVPKSEHYVGIATGGAMIAIAVSLKYSKSYSIIKDSELKGRKPSGNWVLIDDVVTTESSLREALRIIGSLPKNIFVVVDRRKNKKLNLEAMFEV